MTTSRESLRLLGILRLQDDAEYIAGRLALNRGEDETPATLMPRAIATETPA